MRFWPSTLDLTHSNLQSATQRDASGAKHPKTSALTILSMKGTSAFYYTVDQSKPWLGGTHSIRLVCSL